MEGVKRLRILAYICLWYFFSTCLSLYNKNLVGKTHFNFPFPLLTSAIHSGLHWLVSALVVKVLYRAGASPPSMPLNKAGIKDHGRRSSGSGKDTPLLQQELEENPDLDDPTSSSGSADQSGWIYATRVVPCGIATGLDIGFSNASLVHITLSFYTMCKSTVPMWCLLFAFLLRLEQPTLRHILVIAMIVLGAIVTVMGETRFDGLGFFLIMTAACMSGLRWALTQMLLHRSRVLGTHNPIVTLYYLCPVSFAALLVLSWLLEDPTWTSINWETFGWMAIGGVLAYCMILAEFLLIASTSVLTMAVAGVFKEVVVIAAAMFWYGDTLSPLNALGIVITVAGVLWYNLIKKGASPAFPGNTPTSANSTQRPFPFHRNID